MFDKLAIVDQNFSPELRKIIRNMGWLSAERLLNIILSLLVGIYVVRYLGPENFGKLSYGISFVGLFGVIAKLGLDSIVVRNIVQDENSTAEILGTAFFLKLIGSFVTVTLVGGAALASNYDSQMQQITLIVASGLVFQSFEVIDFWFQSKVRSGAMAGVRSVGLIFDSAVKLSLIVLRLPLMAFIWLMLVDVLIVVAGMLWVYFKHSQSILQWKVRWSRAVGLLKDSWPLILSAAMITIYMRIDQIMLGNMTSNEVVGNYAAAVKLSEAWYFVPIIICSSVFPAIIRAKHRSAQEYYRKMQQLYDLLAWISLAVTVPTTFFSSNLMTALVGKEYISAGPILALTMWAGPFVFLGVARSQWLVAENLTQFSFLSTALGAITNVVLNLILIPHYGGSGAALATVISYALAGYFSCFLFPPLIKAGLQQTKAIIVPFRINQNIIYFRQVFQLLGFNQ